jgi:hypothetical protein
MPAIRSALATLFRLCCAAVVVLRTRYPANGFLHGTGISRGRRNAFVWGWRRLDNAAPTKALQWIASRAGWPCARRPAEPVGGQRPTTRSKREDVKLRPGGVINQYAFLATCASQEAQPPGYRLDPRRYIRGDYGDPTLCGDAASARPCMRVTAGTVGPGAGGRPYHVSLIEGALRPPRRARSPDRIARPGGA